MAKVDQHKVWHQQPIQLTAGDHPLFALHTRPAEDPPSSVQCCVLIVQPLLEEMNATRNDLSRLRWALASHGMASLLVDLSGTGDSGGDLALVSLDTWRADLLQAADWISQRHTGPCAAVAVRGGALLLQQLLASWDSLVLWQPYLSGGQLLDDWVRLRRAALMMAGKKQGKAELLAELTVGGAAVDWFGYQIPGDLAAGLQPLELAAVEAKRWLLIDSSSVRKEPNAAVQAFAAAAPHQASAEVVQGQAYWSGADLPAPELLIRRSVSALEGLCQ